MKKGFSVTVKTRHNEVTGSNFIMTITRPNKKDEIIIVDAGLIQEEKYNHLNYLLGIDPKKISSVFLTHAHLDHIGQLPLLVSNGYSGPIYCSKYTKIATPIALKNSAKIMAEEYRRFGTPTLFNDEDVEVTRNLLIDLPYDNFIQISDEVRVIFGQNGHLRGAAVIMFEISCSKYEPKRYVFTGDYFPTNELYEVAPLPKEIIEAKDVNLYIESTYGAAKMADVTKNFGKYFIEAMENFKNIIYSEISFERLEIKLLNLKFYQDSGINTPKIIICTPLGIEFLNALYLKWEDVVPFMPKNVSFCTPDQIPTILTDNEQKIIIAASGMGDKGAVVPFLENLISKKDTYVLFSCYLPKSSLGYKLLHAKKGSDVYINGKPHIMNATVRACKEFSHHAKIEQSLELIDSFKYPIRIFINHGETNTVNIFKETLEKIYYSIPIYIANRSVEYINKSDNTFWSNISTWQEEFVPDTILKQQKQVMHKNKRRGNKQSKKYVNTNKTSSRACCGYN